MTYDEKMCDILYVKDPAYIISAGGESGESGEIMSYREKSSARPDQIGKSTSSSRSRRLILVLLKIGTPSRNKVGSASSRQEEWRKSDW